MIDLSLLGDAFEQGLTGRDRPEYIDPWGKYGEKAPEWAQRAWAGEKYFNSGTRLWADPKGLGLNVDGHEIAAIGGKGSGKTFTGGCRQLRQIQRFPGTKWLIAANTYSQAYGSAGVKLVEIANGLGIEFFHRSEMILDGVKTYNVYVFPEYDAHVCILSFDNIKMIEGTEWDGAWFEEIQDCEREAVETAVSRIRRGKADDSVFYAGMPDDVNHWMYTYFDENDIPLYEPPLGENEHNLPEKYMERMQRYHGHQFDQYVLGKRISLNRTPALRSLQWDIHVDSDNNPDVDFSLGPLSTYDPQRKLYMTWDFNVNPLCVSLWQIKPYRFNIGGEPVRTCPQCAEELKYSHLWDGWACLKHGHIQNPDMTRTGLTEKEVLAQVDEFELFAATTEAMCDMILTRYGNHHAGGLIIGDSTGSKTSTNTRDPGRTDWSIIERKFGRMRGMVVRPGVVKSRDSVRTHKKRGEKRLKYSNPAVRDRVTILDNYMLDEDGHPRISFLPVSEYPSGGVARSCAGALWTADSKIDSSNDRLPATDRNVARTHYFDGVGYLVYHLVNGKVAIAGPEAERSGVQRVRMERRMRYS